MEPLWIAVFDEPFAHLIACFASLVNDPCCVKTDDVLRSRKDEKACNGGTCRTSAIENDLRCREILANEFERIAKGSENDDGGAMLIIMEDRDIEKSSKA